VSNHLVCPAAPSSANLPQRKTSRLVHNVTNEQAGKHRRQEGKKGGPHGTISHGVQVTLLAILQAGETRSERKSRKPRRQNSRKGKTPTAALRATEPSSVARFFFSNNQHPQISPNFFPLTKEKTKKRLAL
jgi:hypothetical protein